MTIPTPPFAGPPPVAAPQGTGNRWLGITALVFGAAVAVFEMIALFGVNTLLEMGSGVTALVLVTIPTLLFIGIVLCIVAGAVAPRWRKLAVIGGILLGLPVIMFVGSIVFFAVTGSGLPS